MLAAADATTVSAMVTPSKRAKQPRPRAENVQENIAPETVAPAKRLGSV